MPFLLKILLGIAEDVVEKKIATSLEEHIGVNPDALEQLRTSVIGAIADHAKFLAMSPEEQRAAILDTVKTTVGHVKLNGHP